MTWRTAAVRNWTRLCCVVGCRFNLKLIKLSFLPINHDSATHNENGLRNLKLWVIVIKTKLKSNLPKHSGFAVAIQSVVRCILFAFFYVDVSTTRRDIYKKSLWQWRDLSTVGKWSSMDPPRKITHNTILCILKVSLFIVTGCILTYTRDVHIFNHGTHSLFIKTFFSLRFGLLYRICSTASCICVISVFTIKMTDLFQVEHLHKLFSFSLLPPSFLTSFSKGKLCAS